MYFFYINITKQKHSYHCKNYHHNITGYDLYYIIKTKNIPVTFVVWSVFDEN
jgi:hypothetical protein